MGAVVGMTGGIGLWGAVWMALALALTGASVFCGLAACRRPGHPLRAFVAVLGATVMVSSTLDMALAGTLLGPLAWAAVLLALMLASLLGTRADTAGGRRAAAQHAAGFLFMAVMWLAMLPAAPATAADVVGPATLHPAHIHAVGSLVLPLGWALIAASVAVVVLVVHETRGQIGRTGGRRRWAAAQHASMGLAMSAMTAGMIVPMMFS
jgi:drug/metabolite transporter superfamily protein YnfA